MHGLIRRQNLDGSNIEIVARGVRNSVGFDWHPQTKELWFTDNGRDWAGDAGPEEELNRVAANAVGAFFGFPYCHANGIPDPDIKKPNPCVGVTLPAATLGPHAAALGMRFYTGNMFPAAYKNTAFIARRGSWNRTKKFGYDVVLAKINGGKATITPFLTGFLDPKTDAFWGRPSTCCRCRTARCWSRTSRTARSTASPTAARSPASSRMPDCMRWRRSRAFVLAIAATFCRDAAEPDPRRRRACRRGCSCAAPVTARRATPRWRRRPRSPASPSCS